MFGSLLERPLVAADALDRYPFLLSMFDKELDSCKLLYNKHVEAAEELGEIHDNPHNVVHTACPISQPIQMGFISF